jgi:hypothetical protein
MEPYISHFQITPANFELLNIEMSMTKADGKKSSLDLGQAQKCTRVKPVNKVAWWRIQQIHDFDKMFSKNRGVL